jgi:hypothetical protein
MTEGEKADWDFAKARFDRIRQQYLDLDGVPGVNVQFALQLTFAPLAKRYNAGERTDELYLEMLEVE